MDPAWRRNPTKCNGSSVHLMQVEITNEDYDLIHVLLINEHIPRTITYDCEWPRFALHTLTDDQCWANFKFVKQNITRLATLLSLPDVIRVSNDCVCSRVDALCIVLRRFSYPNRLCDLESFVGRPSSTLSLIINETVHQLWSLHRHRLTSLDLPWLQQHYLQQYADTIHMKGAPLQNCICFVDGTVRPICRPTCHQRVCYNGHKRIHALKFQSVVVPNGLIANLHGPIEGCRHNRALLRASGLMEEFEALQQTNRAGLPFALYGDPAYPLRPYVHCHFRGANLTNEQQLFNSIMSSVCECVEWEFGKILQIFAFLDFRKNLKVLLSPIAKFYLVAGLLSNCHTCLYGSQTSRYFDLDPPQLEFYLT